MSTTTATASPAVPTANTNSLAWFFRDSINEARRHLIAIPRSPELLIFSSLQPIMFVLLFRYVYDGSIEVPGMKYVQFLLPGIFAQTVVFGSAFTGIGIAEDMQKGFIDRLRTLPIVQPAILVGRTFSDLARNLLTFAVMLAVSFLVGFRWEGGLVKGLVATALLLGFSYSFSWIQALVGLSVSNVEAANSAGFIWMFPLTFVSSAFVPTENMPAALAWVAERNPFTIATNAARALYNGLPEYGGTSTSSLVLQSATWAIGITAVFGLASFLRFGRSSK